MTNISPTDKEEFSAKVTRYFESLKQIQKTNKPSDVYGRDSLWRGEACDNCGSTEKPSKVGGRYVIGCGESEEETDSLIVCGNCLDKLEKKFDLTME